MAAAYALIGTVSGFLSFVVALILGASFWTALLLYFVGGNILMGLAALRIMTRDCGDRPDDVEFKGLASHYTPDNGLLPEPSTDA